MSAKREIRYKDLAKNTNLLSEDVMTYNGSLTREQFMFQEMRLTMRLVLDGLTDQEVLDRVITDNLFQYPTEREVKSKCRACLKRIHCIEDMTAITQELAYGTLGEAKQATLIAIMCQNQLMAEFMVCVIGEKYRNLDMTITRKDMNVFFHDLAERDETVAGWTENTVNKIKSVFRNCLSEAEFIANSRSEILQPVMISEEFIDDLKRTGHREFLVAFNVLD